MNLLKHLLAWGFGIWGAWFLYLASSRFSLQTPLSSSAMFMVALTAFAVSYFSWKQRWYTTAAIFLLLVIVSDVAAVFYAGQR